MCNRTRLCKDCRSNRAPEEARAANKPERGYLAAMDHKIILDGITFDDVLLLPAYSELTPDMVDTSTRLTRSITVNIPIVSSPMDTVTESDLARALAQEGGVGIIHKNLPPEVQAREVAKVKRSEHGVVVDPVTLAPSDTLATAAKLMAEQGVSGFPVTEDGSRRGKVVGILTRRDMKFLQGKDLASIKVRDVMTTANLLTALPDVAPEVAEQMMSRARVEKLLLVDGEHRLRGLITMRDVENVRTHPKACRDARGRLRVGAAVGVRQFDRAELLIAAEVDVLWWTPRMVTRRMSLTRCARSSVDFLSMSSQEMWALQMARRHSSMQARML